MQVQGNCEVQFWIISKNLFILSYRQQLVDMKFMHLRYFKAPTNLISKIKNVSRMPSGYIFRLSLGRTLNCYLNLPLFFPIFFPSLFTFLNAMLRGRPHNSEFNFHVQEHLLAASRKYFTISTKEQNLSLTSV